MLSQWSLVRLHSMKVVHSFTSCEDPALLAPYFTYAMHFRLAAYDASAFAGISQSYCEVNIKHRDNDITAELVKWKDELGLNVES